MALTYIGMGSNIDPSSNIIKALTLLSEKMAIRGISTFYETLPLGRNKDPFYYNGVLKIETVYSPDYLKFNILRNIESALRRRRGIDKFAPRTIDLDILVYGDLSIHNRSLDIPDPDIKTRPFLSAALSELDCDLYFPEWGLTIIEINRGFEDIKLKALTEFTEILREDFLYGHQEGGKTR